MEYFDDQMEIEPGLTDNLLVLESTTVATTPASTILADEQDPESEPEPRRYHLPTAEETIQSHETISCTQRQISWLQNHICIEESKLSKWLLQWNSRFQCELQILTARYEAEKSAAMVWSDLLKNGYKDCLVITERALEEEKAFLAPIRRLPVETLSSILCYCVENELDVGNTAGVQERQALLPLMTVCRVWRYVLLSISGLWTDISLFPRNKNLTQGAYLERLDTSIDRAGKTSINLTINPLCTEDNQPTLMSAEEVEETSTMLLQTIMTRIPVENWKSLRIVHAEKFPFLQLDKYLRNKSAFISFTQLDTLQIVDPPRNKSHFFDLLSTTCKSLKNLKVSLSNKHPRQGEDSLFFQTYKTFGEKLFTLQTTKFHAARIHLPNSLNSLYIDYLPNRSVELPRVETLQTQACNLSLLRTFRLPNLTRLKCTAVLCEIQDTNTVEFPNLLSINVTDALNPGLALVSAPKLEELYIHAPSRTRKEPWTALEFLGSTDPPSHVIRPSIMTIDTRLTTENIISILRANIQLVEFTIFFDGSIKWKKKLNDALCKIMKSEDGVLRCTLCPELESFTAILDWEQDAAELEAWKAVASTIITTRTLYGPPLTIKCKWKGGKEETFCPDEILVPYSDDD